jgi:hypothetical protein
MTFKVNYGFQKAERDRAKQAKKEAKRREKEEAAQKTRSPGDPGDASGSDDAGTESMPGEEQPS